ncbi:MAG: hypothetical protein ACI9NT_001375 [Bacteroidia bacterium]|jgi:hypothetical protein
MRFLGTVILMLLACSSSAQLLTLTIEDLSSVDRQYMEQQRVSLKALAARHLGRQFNGQRETDLAILQALLDRRHVRQDQTLELQAMGVVMGDLLAKELHLDWVVYIDKHGRSRALRYRETDNYLFPITLISRRREADNLTPVSAIYDQARDGLVEDLPPNPFQ